MSAQRLGQRKIGRIAAATGLNVTRAWVFDHHWAHLYVPLADGGHEHYRFHLRTHELVAEPDPIHWTSCGPTDAEAG